MQRADQAVHRPVAEPVPDLLRLAARLHHAFLAQFGEVLRQRGLRELGQALVDLADGQLLADQQAQHAQALRVGQRLQQARGLAGAFLHHVEIGEGAWVHGRSRSGAAHRAATVDIIHSTK
uniref:Uncharacterized protein n=1 Tax=Mizugakiibacter sediminis TaxID=1475481 RepID=A0A0U1PBI4_9GAMM